MEIRQLATFIRVAQFNSFSRAAESLGYSQSAVTVQIRQLEEELDTRLFDRMGKRIALTDTGERFFNHACEIMSQVNQAPPCRSPPRRSCTARCISARSSRSRA